ncbi:MAG: hypothetical protein WCQ99_04735, partial [Pseudomonadota bacterium]
MTAPVLQPDIWRSSDPSSVARMRTILEIDQRTSETFTASLPFSLNDTTAGSENELQTVVIGKKQDVDLPRTIESSNYYKNILKRIKRGDTPKKVVNRLERFLDDNRENVWDHSWVHFPFKALHPCAQAVFKHDLLADKAGPEGPRRGDVNRFIFQQEGETHIRIPVSYLLKLSLANAVNSSDDIHPLIRKTGMHLMPHFLNDNTSPEIFSFHPVSLSPGAGMGKAIARETAKRFLLTQLLTMYANRHFELTARGQQVIVYFAPHPPVRQKLLNTCISDSFYRELFMSPCLSGWNRGEDKYHYMGLCHQVLSRSHLNTVAKLKDAGIITRNLVVLPNVSNISLANNGTHISLGSRRLSGLLQDGASHFTPVDEKYLGDLVIKIAEHFLPLFVGTYSAAPYRLDFSDFHPEQVLGFLAHELDYTHLRMLWRRWSGKADLKIMGRPLTPFGPKLFDTLISKAFGLKGDFINDFRLIDYLVALLSTDQSPALDGRPGNDARLKRDLSDLGVFDTKMPLYLLYRQRQFSSMGFSGFEGRYYSLFESIMGDMGNAASLQTLITALAFKYILNGKITHDHIPDDPTVESERRQIFFGAAIGIPTFFVRADTRNAFMLRILKKVRKTRMSRRYPGYIRLYNLEYQKALIEILKEDAADLIEMLQLSATMENLNDRILYPDRLSASGNLTRGILHEANAASPLKLSADEFNSAAEKFYRSSLRKRHMEEALAVLEADCRDADQEAGAKESACDS